MRCVNLRPGYRSLTTNLTPRLRIPQGQLLTSRYVGCRTIFRSASGATLPAELSPRLGTIFLGLIGLGFISTMLGVSVCLLFGSAITYLHRSGRYEFYSSFAIWPEEVRGDLRAGVKAKQQGNLALTKISQNGFITPPRSVLALTILEASKEAYGWYTAALEHLRKNWSALTNEEKLRAISIGQKLGEMADTYQLGEAEEERWLTWSVEEVLKLAKAIGSSKPRSDNEENQLVLSDLELPKWASVTDIGAPLESLGAFYARIGKLTFAVPLYLHTISLLVPPVTSPKRRLLKSSAELMNNLSELFMRSAPTPAALHQSEAWARQALSLLQKTQGNASQSDDSRVCEDALAVVLFNLGSLREMNGDPKSARQLFEQSFEQSKKLKSQEGLMQARRAIRRLDSKQYDTPQHTSLQRDYSTQTRSVSDE
ncbi:hypothetical protein BGY98DRAFT_1097003 [Russula aff. rugulosa BPL654]|nr:hypothetical protein BGY98DRAFT_1097003 [Russula aff. rugulosa BPL654]